MDEASLTQQLARLSERLSRLERRLGIDDTVPAITEPPATGAGPAVRDAGDAAPPRPQPRSPAIPPPLPYQVRQTVAAPNKSSRKLQNSDLEQAIGLQWAGWIGAVVLVIGAIYGVAYAHEQGWLGRLSPMMQVVLMNLGGVALIGVGEWVYRRVHKLAAAGLFGAGVALLFVSAYAGYAYMNVHSAQAAFALMGVSALVGAGVALRGRLVSIAVLSMIGGNLAPLFLGQEPQSPDFLVAYVTLLQAVALFLAWWGGTRRWWTLRGVALVTTTFWMGSLVLSDSPNYDAGLFVPAVVQAILFQVELILSSARGESTNNLPRANAGTVFSILVTSAFILLIQWMTFWSGPMVSGTWVLATAGVCAAVGFGLRAKDRAGWEGLSLGFRVQSAALLVFAVPVIFSGGWVVAGWGVLALAFAALGRWRDLNLSRIANVVTWIFGAWYLLSHIGPGAYQFGYDLAFTLGGVEFPVYLLVGWILALAGQASAMIAVPQDRPLAWRDVSSLAVRGQTLLADLLWVIVSATALPPISATLAIAAYAWVLVILDRLPIRLNLLGHAWALTMLAGVKWMLIDTAAVRLDPNWTGSMIWPMTNRFMGCGALIVVSLAGLYGVSRRRFSQWTSADPGQKNQSLVLVIVTGVAALLLSYDASLEIESTITRIWHDAQAHKLLWPIWQAIHMSWTMLWMVAAVVYVWIIGYAPADPTIRGRRLAWAGVLPILLGIKFLTQDTLFFGFLRPSSSAPLVMNLPVMVALAVFICLVLAGWIMGRRDPTGYARKLRGASNLLAALVLLWIMSLEAQRWFARAAVAGSMTRHEASFATQVALSICWGIYATACVAVGFGFRSPAIRVFGLVLFALTLVKIVLVDLSDLSRGYRILSFMGVGLLLLATSVLYGKFSTRLTQNSSEKSPEPAS